MRAKRKQLVLQFVTGLMCLPLFAQAQNDFEAFRRQQAQGVAQIRSDFSQYKEKQDREFAGFLKSQWSEFKTSEGKLRIKEPKPKQVPVAPSPNKSTPKPVVLAPAPVIPPPLPPPVKPVTVAGDELDLVFYGNSVKFTFDPKWKSYRLRGGAKPETISNFWTQMSGSKYAATIQTINATRSKLKLDDWASVILWRDVARALQPQRETEQNLLLWFFLIKSGYDVRLGYYGADVFLFEAIKQPVYSTKYTKVFQRTYYAALAKDHGNSIRAFYSYKSDYPLKLKPLDIQSAATDFTKAKLFERKFSFDYKGKTIKFTVPYDRRLVEYMGSIPQSEFELYFDTNGSPAIRNSLLPALKKYTAKMDEEEAINFLLTFVQKAFAYKTDKEQFGYEKYFFVEESLYFPYNDCEDRAVIFSWLVRELLGIKVVGLLYPNHMTTAVELKRKHKGYVTIKHAGKRYAIADPTYIGAALGMAMPSYAKYKPKRVVDIK